MYSALQRKLTGKTLSSYKVDCPADLSLTSAAQGNSDLVTHVRDQAAACPSQRFLLVGYSQGANVVDNSIGISSAGAVVGGPIVATIPAALEPRVAALLLFGNPIRAIGKSVTRTYQSRTIDFCAGGDPICENGGGDVKGPGKRSSRALPPWEGCHGEGGYSGSRANSVRLVETGSGRPSFCAGAAVSTSRC